MSASPPPIRRSPRWTGLTAMRSVSMPGVSGAPPGSGPGGLAEVRQRLLELLHYHQHRLEYRKRTEMAVEIVRQLEAEGHFPEAHYAFDHGVLTLELTRLIERSGKHWVSEVEVSRHIQWQGQWRRVDDVAAELRRQHPESF